MDHLCPRVSFPQAPCLSCLSRPAQMASSTNANRHEARRPSFMELPSDSTGLKTSFAISIEQQELEAITNEATTSHPVDPLPGLAQAFPTIFETPAARTDGLSSPPRFSTMASVRRRSRRIFGQPSVAPSTDLKRRDSATLPSFDYSHRRARKFR